MKEKNAYRPKEIEKYVQEYWEKNKTFRVNMDVKKKKFYCLSMFPYPSGKLHMGHVRNYTIGDVIARCQRMLGKNVLHPMGWDSFGLPAENAAKRNKVSAFHWTVENIRNMKDQLKKLGLSYDWSRELSTCEPNYYRWEQWFFTKLYEKGLIYKKLTEVNWCPTDKTVLANEQVVNGSCWYCEGKIERKNQLQWFIKITQYSEELLQGLNDLKRWPKKVKTMQRNWIGREEGLEIEFRILHTREKLFVHLEKRKIYTIMGISCLYIASNHPLIIKISKKDKRIRNFIQSCRKIQISEEVISTIEKEGVFSKMYSIHPITGKSIPIWIVNFLFNQNICVKLSIPNYNHEDYKFSKKYNIPFERIILKNTKDLDYSQKDRTEVFEETILTHIEEYDGMKIKDINNQITKKLTSLKVSKKKIVYRLRDWEVSRQRLWGVRIPIATKDDKKVIVIPEKYLPIISYEDKKGPKIYSEFKDLDKFKNNSIRIEGEECYLEKDTLDTFVQSSWYYARHTCPNYNEGMLDKEEANYWLPIDQYIGGIEHATMHLLYIRFFHKLMRDQGLLFSNEPVKSLLCQGMILSDAFYSLDKDKKKIWLSSDQISIKRNKNGRIVESKDRQGNSVTYAGMIKMSKSKNNGVNPERILEKYGADTMRLFMMFIAPIEMNIEWRISQMNGAHRFIKKLWKMIFDHSENQSNEVLQVNQLTERQIDLYLNLQKTIKKVTQDMIDQFHFNTAISEIMKFVNKISNYHQKNEQDIALIKEAFNQVVLMLFPVIPHVCFILWKVLGNHQNIDFQEWPRFDESYINSQTKKSLIVQINGKFYDKIYVKENFSEEKIISIVRKKCFRRKLNKIKRVIYIRSKLINILVNLSNVFCSSEGSEEYFHLYFDLQNFTSFKFRENKNNFIIKHFILNPAYQIHSQFFLILYQFYF